MPCAFLYTFSIDSKIISIKEIYNASFAHYNSLRIMNYWNIFPIYIIITLPKVLRLLFKHCSMLSIHEIY